MDSIPFGKAAGDDPLGEAFARLYADWRRGGAWECATAREDCQTAYEHLHRYAIARSWESNNPEGVAGDAATFALAEAYQRGCARVGAAEELAPYALRSASNRVLSGLRAEKRWVGRIGSLIMEPAERGPRRLSRFDQERFDLIWPLVEQLPELQRIVLRRREMDGDKVSTIAADLGCSAYEVSRLLREAKRSIRRALRNRGWRF